MANPCQWRVVSKKWGPATRARVSPKSWGGHRHTRLRNSAQRAMERCVVLKWKSGVLGCGAFILLVTTVVQSRRRKPPPRLPPVSIVFKPLDVAQAVGCSKVTTSLKYDPIALEKASAFGDVRYAAWRKSAPSLAHNWEGRVGVYAAETDFTHRSCFRLNPFGSSSPPWAVYHGLLHAHTSHSDGLGSPEEALQMARDVAKLDFFALTDHPEYWLFRNKSAWQEQGELVRTHSTPQFVALRGFEYSNTAVGHFIVLGTTEWTDAIRYPTLQGFYRWLEGPGARGGVVAFAHPGFHVYRRPWDFFRFRFHPPVAPAMVGLEMMHMGAWRRYLKGFSGTQSYLDDALDQGWSLAPLAAQDNHLPNWGLRDQNRVGVVLETLSPKSLLEALSQRRFFATDNQNIQFLYYGHAQGTWVTMGQEVVDTGNRQPMVFWVRYADPDGRTAPHRMEVWSGSKALGSLTLSPQLTPTRAPTGGVFSWSVPPEIWDALSPGQRVSLWVRFYEKDLNGEDVATFSAPIFFKKPSHL